MDAGELARAIGRVLATKYSGFKYRAFGDPTGDNRVGTDKSTPLRVLRANGVTVFPAATNDIDIRISAVTNVIKRLVQGRPGLLVSPTCQVLRQGFRGGYHYRRMQVPGTIRHDTVPNKNRFSHPHDALQYAMIGGGEGKLLMRASNEPKPKVARRDWSPMDRRKPRVRSIGR
jgi:hypothetical protein